MIDDDDIHYLMFNLVSLLFYIYVTIILNMEAYSLANMTKANQLINNV